jgi:hypothetical protein
MRRIKYPEINVTELIQAIESGRINLGQLKLKKGVGIKS